MTLMLHPRVLELMASRICHDLVSPVGAVNNGVELMQELGADAGDEAVKLVESSATQASARLKCFRLAYGAAGSDQNIGFREVRDAFDAWSHGGRLKVEYAPDIAVKFSMPPKGFYKCLLNILVLADECNRGDSDIAVAADASAGVRICVFGNAAFRDGMETALKGDVAPESLDARAVHAYITGKFVEYFGLKLSAQAGDGRIDFTLSY